MLWRALLLLPAAILCCAQTDTLARKSSQVKQLMSEGRFAEAVPLCQELVQALPDNPGLRLNLGLALQMSGRNRDAIPEFERVLKAQPANLPALLSLGMARLQTNDPARAVAPLEKAVAMDAANVNARGMLAGALLRCGRPADAATHYLKLTAAAPGDPKVWDGLGRAYEALAQKAFEQLSDTAGGSPEWLSLVAESRLVRRQYRSAFFFYKQALERNASFAPAVEGLAEVYRATEHTDWAARQAAKLGKPDCVREKQSCAFAAGRFAEAAAGPSLYWRIRSFNELAKQAYAHLGSLPESVEVHAVKAQIAADQGRRMDAVAEWQAALKLAPGDPNLEQQLGAALQAAGDFKSALPIFERLLAANRGSAEMNFYVGDLLLRMEEAEKAEPYLAKAVEADPKLMPAQAALGLALMKTGKTEEAIRHLEPALASDQDGSLHYQLARAYQAGGNAEKSRALLARYQELQKRSKAEESELEAKAQITAP